jgi:hypothetical protein
MKKYFLLSVMLVSFVIFSCSAPTFINDSWKKSGYNGKKFQKIMVISAGGESFIERAILESEVIKKLKVNNIDGVSGVEILPNESFDKDKDGNVDDKGEFENLIKNKVKELNIDGVIFLTLKDLKKDVKYTPGTTVYSPTFYYDPFYRHYYTVYNAVHSPGYYTKTARYYMETSLFDAITNELVYSILSETIDPQSINDFAKSYSEGIVNKMINDKAIIK